MLTDQDLAAWVARSPCRTPHKRQSRIFAVRSRRGGLVAEQ